MRNRVNFSFLLALASLVVFVLAALNVTFAELDVLREVAVGLALLVASLLVNDVT